MNGNAAWVEVEAGAATLHMAGEFDFANMATISTAVAPLLGTGVATIALDAAQLTFMDSSALAALIGVAREFGGRITVRHPSSFLSRLIAVSGLASILQVEPAG